jgi:thymidylate kinase
MEACNLDFHHRVRAGYLEMIAQEPERWICIDARQRPGEVQAAIRRSLAERQGFERGEGTG